MTLPINHLKKTLDRCCGQWEFVEHPVRPDLFVVRFLNTGEVYQCFIADDEGTWLSSMLVDGKAAYYDHYLASRLNGLTRVQPVHPAAPLQLREDASEWIDWGGGYSPEDAVSKWVWFRKREDGDVYHLWFYDIDWDDVHSYRLTQPIAEVPPPVASPFDVGDRVKCIKEGSTILNVGCVYTVRDYSTNGIRVLDGVADWLPFDCFELVPPVEPAVKECLTPERRTDTEGRDVTDLPGLWDESDTVEPEQPEPFNAGDWVVAICWTGDFNAGSVHQIHDIAFRRATPAEVLEHNLANGYGILDEQLPDKPDADGWIEWQGGECPVPEGVPIDVRFRDGYERLNSTSYNTCKTFWLDENNPADIVAYRLVQPAPQLDW